MKLAILIFLWALLCTWAIGVNAQPKQDFRYFSVSYSFQALDGHTGCGDFQFWTTGHMKSRESMVADLKEKYPEITIVTIASLFEFKSKRDYEEFTIK
jgi:hypothetical protein